MLGRKDYRQEELDSAQKAIREQPAAYKRLVSALRETGGDPDVEDGQMRAYEQAVEELLPPLRRAIHCWNEVVRAVLPLRPAIRAKVIDRDRELGLNRDSDLVNWDAAVPDPPFPLDLVDAVRTVRPRPRVLILATTRPRTERLAKPTGDRLGSPRALDRGAARAHCDLRSGVPLHRLDAPRPMYQGREHRLLDAPGGRGHARSGGGGSYGGL